MGIREVRVALIEEIQAHLCVIAAGHPISELGQEMEGIVASFQALGACNLLLSADRHGLFRNLVLSGYGRRFYLRKCREQGVTDDPSLAISRTESFMDLVAAGDYETAREIALASAFDWMPDGEYEEDHCYHALLHGLLRGESETALAGLVARWDRVLGGASSARLTLCRALTGKDAATLSKAFDALLVERDAETAAMESLDDPKSLPRRHLFIEGLALVELARMQGLPLELEHPLCPALARNPPAPPRPDDLFREIEVQFGL